MITCGGYRPALRRHNVLIVLSGMVQVEILFSAESLLLQEPFLVLDSESFPAGSLFPAALGQGPQIVYWLRGKCLSQISWNNRALFLTKWLLQAHAKEEDWIGISRTGSVLIGVAVKPNDCEEDLICIFPEELFVSVAISIGVLHLVFMMSTVLEEIHHLPRRFFENGRCLVVFPGINISSSLSRPQWHVTEPGCIELPLEAYFSEIYIMTNVLLKPSNESPNWKHSHCEHLCFWTIESPTQMRIVSEKMGGGCVNCIRAALLATPSSVSLDWRIYFTTSEKFPITSLFALGTFNDEICFKHCCFLVLTGENSILNK